MSNLRYFRSLKELIDRRLGTLIPEARASVRQRVGLAENGLEASDASRSEKLSLCAKVKTILKADVPPNPCMEGLYPGECLHERDILFQAARYALLGPGKRVRPLLTLAIADMLGADLQVALDPACALELLHTYSLIHDDLPSMDNDDFRRGRPTLHKAFSEATAILTGDYLLTYAFEVLAKAPSLPPQTTLELIAILSERGGGSGMIGGQMMDLEEKSLDEPLLECIHRKKTAALFEAAALFGALVGKVTKEERENLGQLGLEIGLLFQIMDDIHDVEQDAKTGIKKSYPALIGLEKAHARADALLTTIEERLEVYESRSEHLSQFVKKLINKSS